MADTRMVNLEFEPTPRQWQALDALKIPLTDADWDRVQEDTEPIDVNYGGGKGGGKSVELCVVAYFYCLAVASYFALPAVSPNVDVPHVAWIGRKVAQVFVGTTLDTWKSLIPSGCYALIAASEKHPRHIRIGNRVAIDYGGLDSRIDLERFNSAEYGMILVDQGEETKRDDVSTLKASRRKKLYHPGKRKALFLPYRGLWSCNPRSCWLKEDFIDNPTVRRIFVPALYKDNPHLPPAYMKTLEDSFAHRPDLLRAYRDGIWEGLSDVDQVILEEWIAAAKQRMGHQPYIKRLVSVDPAYLGSDLCVILGLENTRIVGVCILPQSSSKEIAHEAYSMALAMGVNNVPVPVVVEQVGADDVSGRLMDLGGNVITYNPSQASSEPEKYYNKRAEVWSTVARWFQAGVWDVKRGQLVSLPEADDRYEADASESALWQAWRNVCKEMAWIKYEFRGQRILIQSKDSIRADHEGKSPDHADAYVNGVFHLPYVETMEVRERERPRRDDDRSDRRRKMSL